MRQTLNLNIFISMHSTRLTIENDSFQV